MSRSDTDRINRGQILVGQGVEKAYTQADFGRFPASPLEKMNASLRVNPATAQSAFLGNMANPFAGSFQQQRTPGAQYVNYERMAPNVGGPLQAPQVPEGYVPLGTQPEVIRVNPDGTPAGDEDDVDLSDPDRFIANQQAFLDDINEERADKGLPPFNTFQEYIFSSLGGPGRLSGLFGGMAGIGGEIGMADGGIASLEPMYMNEGGIMGALRSLGSGIGNLAQQGFENYQANQKRQQEKRLEDMTREELLEYIRSGGKSNSGNTMGFNVPGIRAAVGMGGNDPMKNATPPINAMNFSDGGDVDFPRMNGPISGPGTETSDDIPAMLSDGEFVVNAKAVRGIGSLEGAGKSKEEQRREGARMMYALQRAGEKAMGKA